MSIRLLALYVGVAGLSIYAWKDWFKSLCGLIVLMALIEYGEEMPSMLLGIQGLNPWNVLFTIILLAWATSRAREGHAWDMPRHVTILLLLYLGVILLGVLRAALDPGSFKDYPLRSLISEELINTIKWVLPGILLFDGCRTRKRAILALACLLTMYSLLAMEVVRYGSPGAVFSDSGAIHRVRQEIGREVGYGAPDLAVAFAGASWGMVASLGLVRKKCFRLIVLTGVGVVIFALALTGGRAGYLAWGGVGLVMCLIKWRKGLLVAPVVVLLLTIVFPGAVGRMLVGFGQIDVEGQATIDPASLSAGRLLFWPYVTAQIAESPLIGYGRLAMRRTGVSDRVDSEFPGADLNVSHPHNMYFETLLDNGILGSIPIWLFWVMVVVYSSRLFRSDNRIYSAVGGLSLSLSLSSLLGGMTGQHYFPQEHTLGIWAAGFLMFRVYVEEGRARIALPQASSLLSDGLLYPNRMISFSQLSATTGTPSNEH